MPFIRPSPPADTFSSRDNQIGDQINNKKIIAGNGISVTQGTAGTTIAVSVTGDSAYTRFKGIYNPTGSYWPNDIVVVPSQSYTDYEGNPIPVNTGSTYLSGSIAYGTYVCNYFVPDATMNVGLLTGSVAPIYNASGFTITPDLANTYRDTTINSYYPTSPANTASMVLVSQSSWQATSNIPFWSALAAGTATATIATRYTLNSVSAGVPDVYANYFIATGSNGTHVRIAKNPKLRNSVSSETIDGTTFNYSYGASSPYQYVSRLASGSSISEYQVVVPRYLPFDEVWAIPISNSEIGGMTSVADSISSTTGSAITLLDLNVDGRAWCARANQTGYE